MFLNNERIRMIVLLSARAFVLHPHDLYEYLFHESYMIALRHRFQVLLRFLMQFHMLSLMLQLTDLIQMTPLC